MSDRRHHWPYQEVFQDTRLDTLVHSTRIFLLLPHRQLEHTQRGLPNNFHTGDRVRGALLHFNMFYGHCSLLDILGGGFYHDDHKNAHALNTVPFEEH